MRTKMKWDGQRDRQEEKNQRGKEGEKKIQLHNVYSLCGHFVHHFTQTQAVFWFPGKKRNGLGCLPVQVKSCDFCIVSLKV